MQCHIFLIYITAVVIQGVVVPDCSSVDIKSVPLCKGSVLFGQGHCGENVCAQVISSLNIITKSGIIINLLVIP